MPRIEDQSFGTQKCLLRLPYGGDPDDQCPNLRDHRDRHISPQIFLSLIRIQFASDRERGAHCKPLHMKDSRGALFKFRLSLHGYMLVAKGMGKAQRKYLVHESKVYDHCSILHPSLSRCSESGPPLLLQRRHVFQYAVSQLGWSIYSLVSFPDE